MRAEGIAPVHENDRSSMERLSPIRMTTISAAVRLVQLGQTLAGLIHAAFRPTAGYRNRHAAEISQRPRYS